MLERELFLVPQYPDGAYCAALAGVVASSVHWHELPEHRGDEKIGLRVSWV
jgi:diadenosine tetraphosphate (Ap4A) HIT family hydrolase